MTQLDQQSLPKLRFPEFDGTWCRRRCDFFLRRENIPVSPEPNKTYREIGIRSHGKGVFHKEPILGEALGAKRVFEAVPGTLALNIVFAWEQALAVLSYKEAGYIASHRFPMFSGYPNRGCVEFFKYFFLRPRGKWLLELASPGGAGRNKTLGQSNFAELKLVAPHLPEQLKISDFLGAVDTKIAQLDEKKCLLEAYKKGCRQKVFSQKIRFKDDTGNEFPDWEERRLGEVLAYEQPTKYLVASTKYSDAHETPVLTAGKTFILGYTDESHGVFSNLPAIIFDDFTTAFKFVDFPFKAKSSAMKMLTLKNDVDDIRFVHSAMLQVRFQVGEHKRYWIAEYQKEKIPYPHPEEQRKIADFLSALDRKIDLVGQELDHVRTFKQGLLQQMFV